MECPHCGKEVFGRVHCMDDVEEYYKSYCVRCKEECLKMENDEELCCMCWFLEVDRQFTPKKWCERCEDR